MTALIIAEHDNQHLAAATWHAVTAGSKLGEVHVLVAGSGAAAVAEQAKQVAGVAKVLLADAEHYAGGLAEELAPLVVKLAAGYRYITAAASTFGKNLLPRVAALLDCPQVSDLTEIVDGKTLCARFMPAMPLPLFPVMQKPWCSPSAPLPLPKLLLAVDRPKWCR